MVSMFVDLSLVSQLLKRSHVSDVVSDFSFVEKEYGDLPALSLSLSLSHTHTQSNNCHFSMTLDYLPNHKQVYRLQIMHSSQS